MKSKFLRIFFLCMLSLGEVGLVRAQLQTPTQPKATYGNDITAAYLVEATSFSDNGETTRFRSPKYWTVENFEIDEGSNGKKDGIDNNPGFNCLQLGRYTESESAYTGFDLQNSRLYRKVTLSAGKYYFGAKYNSRSSGHNNVDDTYFFVSTELMATSAVESNALACMKMKNAQNDGIFYGITFELTAETEVYLGWQQNSTTQKTEFRCSEVTLRKYTGLPPTQSALEGWTYVDGTTVTLTDLDNYYYLFLDAVEANKSLAYSGIDTDSRPVYQLLQDPTKSIGQVWKLENTTNDRIKLRAYANDWYYSANGNGYDSYMGTSTNYEKHYFILTDGVYNLKVNWNGNYMALGAWSDFNLSGNGLGYAGTAGNKTVGSKEDHGFFIYRIPRANFTPAPKASENYAAAGWKEVTSTDDWGRDGRHYVFLDVSETGFETNMAMTATTGRPRYQFSDMSNPSQKWITEAYDGGYALKDVASGKYTSYTSATDATLYDDTNHSGIKFTPSLTDGKWALSNAKDTSHFLGRWGDSDNGKSGKNDPFAGEEIPANKSAGNGKRLFAVYAIPAAVGAAEALPANGDMLANTWYYFDISNAGNSYAATATSLADIVCISYETSAAVTLSATGNVLAATRYYVKSTRANNLVLTLVDMTASVELARERWHSQYDAIVNQAMDKSAFDTALENAANVSSEAELNAYDATVWQAVCDVLQDADNADVRFDITSLITNPNLDSNTNGWTATAEVRYSTSGVADFFNQTNASFTQTLPDMPVGTYTLKAQANYRSRAWRNAVAAYQQGVDEVKGYLVLGNASVPVCNIYDQPRFQPARLEGSLGGSRQGMVSDSKTTTSAAFGIGQYWNQLNNTTTTAGDLTLGVKIENGLNDNWFCYDNFRLYYGATAIPVDLTQGLPTEDTQATTVTTGITLNAGTYNKVCLPFDLDEQKTSEAFKAAYMLAGVTSDGVGQLVPVSTIEAGKPYLVTVNATQTLTVNDVMVKVAQPDSLPVIWEGAATVGTFNGFTFTVNRKDGVAAEPTYTLIDWQNMSFTVNQENWRARRFLSEVTYDNNVPSKIDYYNVGKPAPLDHPHSVFIPAPPSNRPVIVTVSKNSDYSDAETFAFAGGTTLCEVPNLMPQNTYYYKLEIGGSLVSKGQFQTEGHLRMIKTLSGFNIRDLGGWKTLDDNRVRYGKVFRGGELNYGHTLLQSDLDELRRLGVGAELDYRRDDETNYESPSTSALGSDVNYLYLNFDYSNLSYDNETNIQQFRRAFQFTLDNLRDDRAVYFHCRIGADRTGAFALLLDGLCGLPFDQLCKEYELTSFSEADTRTWDADGVNTIKTKLNYIQSLPGQTLQQKFFYYANTMLGFSADDLFDFIEIMVDGESSIRNADLAFNNNDDEYHQSLQDITAICAAGSTIVNGAKALLSDDGGSTTTEVAMSIDGITVSFADVQLEANKDYMLTIPAESVDKDGTANAAAVTLMFRTPLVFDGDYYLYNEEHEQFLSRNRNYGTRGVLDNFGVPATFTTDKDNITTIKFLDNDLYYGDQDGYTDKGTGDAIRWTLEPKTNGAFLLFLNDGVNKYVTMNYDNTYKYYFNRLRETTHSDYIETPFVVKTAAEQKAIVAAKKEANILTAATAAGITATSLSEFETALAGYSATPSSAVIKSADAGNTSDWKLSEPWARGESGNGYNIGDWGAEFYLKNASVSQTVTVPRAGLYKLTLNALIRQGSASRCCNAGYKGFILSNAFVSINDTYYAQVPDWFTDRRADDSPGSTTRFKSMTDEDPSKYSMEVYAYIDDSKTAKITLTVPGFVPEQWCIFNHWALTEYVPNVTISETSVTAPEACDYANVTFQRSIVANTNVESGHAWNTICFPFALSSDQIKAAFGENTVVKKLSDVSITDGKASLTFEEVSDIEANTPYIMQTDQAGTEYTFNGIAVTPSSDLTVEKNGGVQFVGTDRKIVVPENDFYIVNDVFKKSKGTTNMKGFRAYFHIPASAGIKSFGFDEGNATGIEGIVADELEGTVYDLSGRLVARPSKGMYIVNGKKVFIK